jgi:hypothetical protein
MKDFDRRHAHRISIPEAMIRYTRKNGQSGEMPLIDLTKSSACFIIEHELKFGEMLELEIIIPNKDQINLKSIVIRISDPAEELVSYAVVQFLAFGTDERYNSLHAYEQLTQLLNEYVHL